MGCCCCSSSNKNISNKNTKVNPYSTGNNTFSKVENQDPNMIKMQNPQQSQKNHINLAYEDPTHNDGSMIHPSQINQARGEGGGSKTERKKSKSKKKSKKKEESTQKNLKQRFYNPKNDQEEYDDSMEFLDSLVIPQTDQPSQKGQGKGANEAYLIDDDLQTQKMLFFFNFSIKKFYYADYSTGESSFWKTKDLDPSYETKLPHFKKHYTLSRQEQFSFCQISQNRILIIGGFNPLYSCTEYNFEKNAFTSRSYGLIAKATPSLINIGGDKVAIVGGQVGMEYSPDFDIYDAQLDTYEAMPPMHRPHMFGASYSLNYRSAGASPGDNEDTPQTINKNRKIYVVGGYASNRGDLNPTIEIFSFETKRWSVCDISSTYGHVRPPQFLHCSVVKMDPTKILFINDSRRQYVWMMYHGRDSMEDVEKRPSKLLKLGILSSKDTFNRKGRSPQAVTFETGKVYVLGHQDEVDDEVEVHWGAVRDQKWGVKSYTLSDSY